MTNATPLLPSHKSTRGGAGNPPDRSERPPALAVIHAHSDWSHDGRDSLAGLAAFASERNIRWIFLSDHAEDFGEERFSKYLSACAKASSLDHTLVPGLEFRFDKHPGLHLLAIGLRKWIDSHTLEAFCRQATEHAEFLVMAHPLLTHYSAPEVVLSSIHGVEVWNAGYNTRYLPDEKAITFWQCSRRHWPHLVATAGTDQHDCKVEGRIRIELPMAGDPFKALREGRFRNRGMLFTFSATPTWGRSQMWGLALLRRLLVLLRNGRDLMFRLLGRP